MSVLNIGYSKHIFWDIDIEDLSKDKYKGFIIKRVLEYGLIEDWYILNREYGIEVIVEEVKKNHYLFMSNFKNK